MQESTKYTLADKQRGSLQAKAESNGCDGGVIDLLDRDGTIKICPSLAAKVPQLRRRLIQMGKNYYFTFTAER
jgi:hypothetical protein